MTMKSCNKESKLATARHTQKNGKTEQTNYKLTQQTLLTNLR